jgi:hypothetical protein
MAVFGTLILGNSTITNCETALVVEGEEVFRLRERQHDGQFVVDFDLRDEKENRLAKIAKNHVVYCAPELELRSKPGQYGVFRKDCGEALALVEELSPGTLRLTGSFYIRGWRVNATTSGLTIGGVTFSRNTITGGRKAIVLSKSSIAFGA